MKLQRYFITLFIFFGIDSLWRGVVAPAYGSRMWSWTMIPEIRNPILPGLLYAAFVGGLFYLVVEPGVRSGSTSRTLIGGALFGLISSATYLLTDFKAALEHVGLIAVADFVWGIILTAVVAVVSVWAGKKL